MYEGMGTARRKDEGTEEEDDEDEDAVRYIVTRLTGRSLITRRRSSSSANLIE
jgi:hypothetical protein